MRSVDEVVEAFAQRGYVADRSLGVSVFLALSLERPLFLEGEAGVGKTEVAKVLADICEEPLIRLQCYEGLDVNHALYEWDYARQMLAIRLIEASGGTKPMSATSCHGVPDPSATAAGRGGGGGRRRPVLLIGSWTADRSSACSCSSSPTSR